MIEGHDASALVFISLWFLVPAAFFIWWGFRPLGRRVEHWAAVRDVPLTGATRPLIEARLRRARRWRTIGLSLGWLAPYVELWVTRSAYDTPLQDGPGGWHLWAVGYVLGAVAAELHSSFATRPSGAAMVSSRELDQYLPTRARRWTWVAAAVSVVLVPLAAVLPRQEHWGLLELDWVLIHTVVVLVALIAAETLPRVVIRRRQPFQSEELLRVDDALRSWSAHAVTAALLAVMIVSVAAQVLVISAGSGVGLLRWVGPVLGVALMGLAYAVFFQLSDYRWRWRVERVVDGSNT